MKTVRIDGIRGHLGSWTATVPYTDGSTEELPVVHGYFWQVGPNGPFYSRSAADCNSGGKWPAHIALLAKSERVVVSKDKVPENDAEPFEREAYAGVFEIADFVHDQNGLRFKFTKRLPEK